MEAHNNININNVVERRDGDGAEGEVQLPSIGGQ